MISLIIFIIMMVILVGINITIFTDPEKGVIKRTLDAVDESNLAEEEDLLRTTWHKLYLTQTIITHNDLKEKLSGWTTEGENLVSPNGNKFKVDELGEITVIK